MSPLPNMELPDPDAPVVNRAADHALLERMLIDAQNPGPSASAAPSDEAPAAPVAAPAAPAPSRPAPAGAAAASQPMKDPAFLAFLADQAQTRAQLAAAQKKADRAAMWADVGNSFRRAGDTIAGRQTDEAALAANLERARQPVRDLAERMAFDKEGLANAESAVTLQGTLAGEERRQAIDDPTSPLSRRAALLAVAQGMIPVSASKDFTAGMLQQMQQGASLQEARRQHDQRLAMEKSKEAAGGARQDKQLAQQQAELDERVRHNKAEEGLAGEKASKELPARQAERLAETKAAIDQLDAAFGQLQESGTGITHSINEKLNPWSADDSASKAAVEALLPVVARALHGGAPSHTDMEAAKKYLPQLGDQPSVVAAKYKQLRQTLLDRQAEALQTYGETGKKVGNVTPNAPATDILGRAKAMLQPGERLVADAKGGLHALGAGEELPSGWTAVP